MAEVRIYHRAAAKMMENPLAGIPDWTMLVLPGNRGLVILSCHAADGHGRVTRYSGELGQEGTSLEDLMEFNVNISMVAAIFILAAIGLIVRLIIWYAEVNSDRKSFKEFMVKVEQNIQKILDKLSGTPPATVPGSPLQLSDYGKKLSDFLKAEEWATETVTTLLPKVRGKDAYQLQEFYNDYVFGEYQPTDQEAQKIRDCIYLNGATRTHVNEVLSLVLRDALLEELGMMQLAS